MASLSTAAEGGLREGSNVAEKTTGLKRYNLTLPDELFKELQQVADKRHTTVVDLLRRFIKLGLIATNLEDTPDAALIIREGDTEREVILL